MTNTTAIAKREHGHVCEWGIWKKKKKRKKANETGWRRKDTAIEEKRKEKIQYQQRWAQCAFCSIMKTINKLALSVQWIGKGNGVMCGGRQWQKGGSKCSIGCACVNVRFFSLSSRSYIVLHCANAMRLMTDVQCGYEHIHSGAQQCVYSSAVIHMGADHTWPECTGECRNLQTLTLTYGESLFILLMCLMVATTTQADVFWACLYAIEFQLHFANETKFQ